MICFGSINFGLCGIAVNCFISPTIFIQSLDLNIVLLATIIIIIVNNVRTTKNIQIPFAMHLLTKITKKYRESKKTPKETVELAFLCSWVLRLLPATPNNSGKICIWKLNQMQCYCRFVIKAYKTNWTSLNVNWKQKVNSQTKKKRKKNQTNQSNWCCQIWSISKLVYTKTLHSSNKTRNECKRLEMKKKTTAKKSSTELSFGHIVTPFNFWIEGQIR